MIRLKALIGLAMGCPETFPGKTYGLPSGQWLLLTLTFGVGGSLLAIGSAPGVGLLCQIKQGYTFAHHMRWMPVILLGYAASIAVHFWINARYF
jgi:Na+/H+ antiporter NhaD/arsenite permease-like protein